MTRTACVAGLVCLAVLAASAKADFYDGMGYADVDALKEVYDPTRAMDGDDSTFAPFMMTDGLTFSGLQTSGSALDLGKNYKTGAFRTGVTGQVVSGEAATTTTFYASMLIKPTSADAGKWGSGTCGMGIAWPGSPDGWALGVAHNEGVLTDRGANDWVFIVGAGGRYEGYDLTPKKTHAGISTKTVSQDEVYLLVAKYEITTEGTYTTVENGMKAWLKVYTVSDGAPASEPTEWDASAAKDFAYPFTGNDKSLDMISAIHSNSPGSAIVDEFRVGSTFASVTPVPEPTTLALLGLGGLAMLRRRRA